MSRADFFETKRMTRRARKVLASGLATMFALLLLFGLQAADPARAATTFTVNSEGDENDLDFPGGAFDGSSDGRCDVDAAAGKQCTLRAAIQQANKSSGADTIAFNIPTTGVATISPGSQLPVINRPVTIDGYTQPGASENTLAVGNDAVIKIELSGENAGAFAGGLQISSTDSTVRGLRINRFTEGVIIPTGATGNKVQGNIIGGLDASGTQPLGNSSGGVLIGGAPDNTVGGTTPGARNIISENGSYGVAILGADATGNRILRNSINDNDNNGVVIFADATENRILGNTIFSNGDLGIDLEGGTEDANDVTANDPRDPDTGPNRLQNYPVISSATAFPTFTSINGTLESTPSTREKTRTFIIQFFSNTSADFSGFGEGKTFIGQTQVSTNRRGNASFSFAPTQTVPVGQFITATATRNATGDTSEFSRANDVEEPAIGG